MNISRDLSRHPCFNAAVKGSYGRVHLPVAPHCNIRCNYCNRKYDCVNESRPGVTSALLSPVQASLYMEKVLERETRIAVAGIAGRAGGQQGKQSDHQWYGRPHSPT